MTSSSNREVLARDCRLVVVLVGLLAELASSFLLLAALGTSATSRVARKAPAQRRGRCHWLSRNYAREGDDGAK